MTSPKPEDVEAVLKHLHPAKALLDLFETGLKGLGTAKGIPDLAEQVIGQTPDGRKLRESRERLLAMPADEVARLDAQANAQQAAQQRATAATLEAGRFYNQPAASADFQFWAEVENWTHDDATALLLGRDPRVVTPGSLAAELKTGTFVPGHGKVEGRAAFHREFDNLNTLVRRADALNSPLLKPQAVLAWAGRLTAITVPPGMAAVIGSKVGVSGLQAAEPAALATAARMPWTDARKAELRAYRAQHGTAAAAHFGISESRIRALLPSKPEAEAKAAAPDLQSWMTRPKRPAPGR